MKISSNADFFQKPLAYEPVSPNMKEPTDLSEDVKTPRKSISSSGAVIKLVKESSETLTKCGLPKMASQVEKILNEAIKERFTVAVVGEFSRGKSTFVNNLLCGDIQLPVGDLPTTAIMTRIRYAKTPKMAIFDDKGSRVGLLDINQHSWDGLVANNFGEEQPNGSVIVGVPNKWLGQNSIELIDCPGAGDLSEVRTQQIVDTLDRADAAIINIAATTPFSITEKEFVLQRILKRKTPFSMIIVNKLDLIRKEERNSIIKHIKNLLELNKINIPIYIPSNVEMPDDTYSNIQGLDVIRSVIARWASDPKRQALTDLWIKARVQDIVLMAIDALKEQQKLYDLDEAHCQEIIQNKKDELSKLDLVWGDLEINMQNRSNACYKTFLEKADEYKVTIIERLQYEAAHSSSPEQWWKEDYPYRLKVEMANMSIGLDNVISKLVTTDINWFNQKLDQKFKNFVSVENTSVADKTEYSGTQSERKVQFDNIHKQQNIARIATVGLSIAGYFALGPGLGILATLGIGTGGAVIQGNVFKKKLEEQRAQLKEAISKDIPLVIDKATEKSEQRIQSLYYSIIQQSSKKKELWIETQKSSIEAGNKPKSIETGENNKSFISELSVISSKLN